MTRHHRCIIIAIIIRTVEIGQVVVDGTGLGDVLDGHEDEGVTLSVRWKLPAST